MHNSIALRVPRLLAPQHLREFSEETLGLFGSCAVDADAIGHSSRIMADRLRGGVRCMRAVHQLKQAGFPFCLKRFYH